MYIFKKSVMNHHSFPTSNTWKSGLKVLAQKYLRLVPMALAAMLLFNNSAQAQCTAWSTLGGAAASSTQALFTSMAIDGAGTKYVAYNDASLSLKVSVKKYNGTSWVAVGTEGFSDGEGQYVNIAIGKNDTPFVAYQDRSVAGNKATVKKFNGTAWVDVGTERFTPAQVNDLSLAINSAGEAYVGYKDNSAPANRASVMKFNYATDSWEQVGSKSFSAGVANFTFLAFSASDVPYIVYQDGANSSKMTVKKFTSGSWGDEGTSTGISVGTASNFSMAFDGDIPYIAYADAGTGILGKIVVRKFESSSWSYVGSSSGNSSGTATYTSIAFDGSTPYIACNDGGAGVNKAIVKKLSAGSFVSVGSASGITTAASQYNTIKIHSGTPYLATMDVGNSSKAFVIEYATTPVATTGTPTLFIGGTTTLSNATASGTWSSTNAAVATVGSLTGIVTGISAGNATIDYTIAGPCVATMAVTVNTPTPGLNFDGSDDRVVLGSVISSGSSYTKEAWIKPTTLSASTNNILSSTDHAFRLSNGFLSASNGLTGSPTTITDASALTANQWVHVAVVYNSSTNALTLYKNGVQVATNGTASSHTAGAMMIGTQNAVLNTFFHGTMDEVRIWNTARTQSEIQTNMSCDVPAQAGLIGYYRFDQGTVASSNTLLTNAYDYSGTGNCGALTNFALTGATSNYAHGGTATCNTITVPTLTVSPTVTICDGTSTSLTVSGGTTYTWTPAESLSASTGSSVTASPSVTTTYTVSGSSGSCNIIATVLVSVNPIPTVGAGSNVTICNGSSTTLTGTGATTYSWTPATGLSATTGTSVTANPSSTTVYTVLGTQNSCTATATVQVSVNPIPSIGAGSNVTICNGVTTTLTGTGGTTYSWSPSTGLSATTGTSVDANPSSTTVYTVIGTLNSCTNTATVQVSVNANPTVGAGSNVTICNGTSTTLTGTGATTYTWAPGASLSATTGASVSANPSSTTVYTVIGTLNSCTNTATVQVSVNPIPTIGAGSNVTICESLSTTLTATGGTTYSWSPSTGLSATTGASVTASPTTTTTYTVIGTLNSCTATATVQVSVNPAPIIGAGSNVTICNGNSTTLTGTGGTTYTWAPGTGLSATTGTSVTANPSSTTIYTVTGTLAGCPGTATVQVSVNPIPTIGAGSDVTTCAGTGVTLTGTGGTTYSWSPSTGLSATTGTSVTANPSSTTVYTVIGTLNSCTATATVQVSVNPLPTVGAGSNVTICNGSTTTLTGTGATTYTWSPSGSLSASTGASVDANPSSTTTYTVIGTQNSCTNTATVQVSVNPIPPVSGGSGATICNGSSTGLTATGASTYTWSPSTGLSATTGASVTANPSSTTVYTVLGTLNSCTATATVQVSVNPLPTIGGGSNVTICNGSSTTLTGTGGTTYTWAPGTGLSATTGTSVTASPSSTTTYTVTGTLNGCPSTGTVQVSVNPLPSIGAGSNVTICNGGSTTLTGTGGTTYTWSPSTGLSATTGASVSASPSSTTVYTVTGTLNGCNNTASVQVSVNPLPPVSGGSGVTICNGSSTGLVATGATTYTWSPATALSATTGSNVTANPSSTTVYTVTGTLNGCPNTATVQVSVNPIPTINAGSGVTTCIGVPTTITATGGTTYTWSPATGLSATTGASVDASPAATTTYTVTGTLNGCSSTATKTVTISNPPIAATGAATICNGNSTVINGTGGTTYTWAPSTGLSATTGSSVTASPSSTTTYTVTGTLAGCNNNATVTVSVNPLPTVSAGADIEVCFNTPSPLSATGATTYTWSPATGLSATTGANVTATVTSNVTYTVTGTLNGCSSTATKSLTVNALPTASFSASPDPVCPGTPVTFTDASIGTIVSYSWNFGDSFSDTGVTTTHVYSVVADYPATLTITDDNGCQATSTITIDVENVMPGGNIGTTEICVNQPLSVAILTNPTPGGTWSSSDISKALVSPTTGLVKGVSPGTVNITYHLGFSCGSVTQITINPAVAVITGPNYVCPGQTTTLFNVTPSGAWSSSNASLASVNTATGVVSGISEGVVTITYQVTDACYKTKSINVQAQLLAITGQDEVCQGSMSTYASGPVLGSWTSSNLAAATINASTGVLTGIGAGVTNITYTASNSCYVVKAVTINGIPATISGTANICPGTTTDLDPSLGGGAWSIANTSIATIDASGVVTGISGGTTTVTYTVASGCYVTLVQTVNPSPSPVVGANVVCTGTSSTFSSGLDGGNWVSSMPTNASVSASGVVTGLNAGNTTISYQSVLGCVSTKDITINATPANITGTLNVCVNGSTTLASTTASGVWSSSNTVKATVNASSGVVAGKTQGTAVITYAVAGCYKTAIVTVNLVPTAITGGSSTVCEGATLPLSSTTTGAVWSSSIPTVATVNPVSGVVTGLLAGATTISYTNGGVCSSTRAITVNASPAAITGTLTVCIGNTTTLESATGGGVWSSSVPTRATVNAGGVVTGLTAGATNITYSNGGCFRTATVTVGALPSAITGPTTVCVGSTIALATTPGGGVWSGSNTFALVSATGVVSGNTPGVTTISYQLSSGCARTRDVTVNPVPEPIEGDNSICIGFNTILTSATTGGTWSSSVPAKATIGLTSGTLNGIAAGTSNVSYTLSTGCRATYPVTVNAIPTAITGTTIVCVGFTSALASTPTGGTWSSTNEEVATVGLTSGVVTGINTGSAVISYTTASGCSRAATVNVNTPPAENVGTPVACLGQPAAVVVLTNSTTGGTWSSSLTTRLSISPTTGAMKGLTAGTVNVTYKITNGCYRISVVTVNPAVGAITGLNKVCTGAEITLADTTAGGTWSSSTTKATADGSTGVITGVTSGSTVISYVVSPACFKTMVVNVNQTPAAIAGLTSVNIGSTTNLTCTPSGGTWMSVTPSIGTITTTSGIFGGVAEGITVVKYTLPTTGCYSMREMTVTPVLEGKGTDINTGTSEMTAKFTVYPNPTSGTMKIESSVTGTFVVFTLDGKTVDQYDINGSTTTITLPNDLAAGVYMCRFSGVDGTTSVVRLVYKP
jgi:hypothetical protein